ncbi:exopolysaccharide biosynthesis protein, partial [Rhizobium leguminosarum]
DDVMRPQAGRLVRLDIAISTIVVATHDPVVLLRSAKTRRNSENQELLNQVNIAIGRAAIDIQVAQLLGEQAGYSAQIAQMNMDTPG